MYTVKNRHSVPHPKKGKAVRKRNQKGRWCPPLFPSLQWHFPVALRQLALPQEGEQLGFPGDPFDGNPEEQESLWLKRAYPLDAWPPV